MVRERVVNAVEFTSSAQLGSIGMSKQEQEVGLKLAGCLFRVFVLFLESSIHRELQLRTSTAHPKEKYGD